MKKNIANGFLISVEGVDGCGKSTFCQLLEKSLSNHYSPIILTKEPGGSTLGKSLRNLLLHAPQVWDSKAEFLLFAADRAQHFTEIVLPALKTNHIVISDRMADSSLVYQGYVKKLPLPLLDIINTWAMQNRLPDLTFFLDVNEETIYKRIAQRGNTNDVFENKKEEIKLRIEGFRDLFTTKKNVFILSANTSSPSELVEQAMAHLSTIFENLS